MHFNIIRHSKRAGSLRVIAEIPNYRLCRVEGINGIGKTMAIRLLELVTGEKPYTSANQAAWASLRAQLGPTDIIVDGLNGSRLDVHLTPDRWPDNPDDDLLGSGRLGTVLLDGHEIDATHVRNLLGILRISGDETIIRRFEGVINNDYTLARRQYESLDKAIEQLGRVADALLRDVLPSSSPLTRAVLSDLDEQLALAEERYRLAASQVEDVVAKVRKLEELTSVASALDDLRAQGPGIDQQLQEIEVAMQENRRKVEHEQRLRAELLPDVERKTALLDRLQELGRLRGTQIEGVRDASTKAQRELDHLGLSHEYTDIAKELAESKSAQTSLINQLAAHKDPLGIIEVVDGICSLLAPVRGTSLDGERIADITDNAVTVRALRDGVERRRDELRRQRDSSMIGDIEARLSAAQEREKRLQRVQRLNGEAARIERALTTTENEIGQVSHELDQGTDGNEEYQAVLNRLDALEQQYIQEVERRVELRRAREYLEREGNETELANRVDRLSEELGDVSALAELLIMVQTDKAKLEEELRTAENALSVARTQRAAFDQDLREVIELFELSPDYETLRAWAGRYLPTRSLATEESLRRLEELTHVTNRLRDLLDALGRKSALVRDALEALGYGMGELRGGSRPYVTAFAEYYAAQFGDLLNTQEMRDNLFGGGRLEHLDLLSGEISWRDGDGNLTRQPIESFSSGEGALAHVLASVLLKAKDPALHRVLVLDEFGAFVDAERLKRLLVFLREQVLDLGRAEQVIMILPLRQPIGESAPAVGRSREVAEHGYIAEDVSL